MTVLRQASKACVVKQKLQQAELLIQQALNLGESMKANDLQLTFTDVLIDYAFYLLYTDSVKESVEVYTRALEYRKNIFHDSDNILIALGNADLAYALYVEQYCDGTFDRAGSYAELSIQMMERILPKNHLLLASARRVKALIIEERVLDESLNEDVHNQLLCTAEEYHLGALKLSRATFGENNLQTAKHYGNLGRLYQSMKRFEEAEKMHLKAIAIKKKVFGPYDYEVGLSAGHLASLYNYHMKKYVEAEQLYIQSIDINMKLFGPAYSGLEYDYRGLVNVYDKLIEPTKRLFYNEKYRKWEKLRENASSVKKQHLLLTPKSIVTTFFEYEYSS